MPSKSKRRIDWGRSNNLAGSLLPLDQVLWFNRLKDSGKLSRLVSVVSAGFVRHAEAQALINAYNALGSLPESIEMFSDRVTCTYACRRDLPDLFTYLGIKTVTFRWRNQSGAPLTWTEANGWN